MSETIKRQKIFRVFRRSENTNSFGLREMWVVNEDDGECYTICGNSLRDMPIGEELRVATLFTNADEEKDDTFRRIGDAQFDGFELVERKAAMPDEVYKVVKKTIWNEEI